MSAEAAIYKYSYSRICEGCDARYPGLIDFARPTKGCVIERDGWVFVQWRATYCPTCRHKDIES